MGGPGTGRQARSAGPVGRMGCIWPAKRYPLALTLQHHPLLAPPGAELASRRAGSILRHRARPASSARPVQTRGRLGWPLAPGCSTTCGWPRCLGLPEACLSFRFPPQAEPPQLCGPDCRRRPRHQARGPVDECSPCEPPCALPSLRVARGLAVRSSSASFTVQVRWRHGCGLLPNGERPCRAHSAEPDIFVAQRAGGEGRRVRRRPVSVASSAEARGDDRHFLSPFTCVHYCLAKHTTARDATRATTEVADAPSAAA